MCDIIHCFKEDKTKVLTLKSIPTNNISTQQRNIVCRDYAGMFLVFVQSLNILFSLLT